MSVHLQGTEWGVRCWEEQAQPHWEQPAPCGPLCSAKSDLEQGEK